MKIILKPISEPPGDSQDLPDGARRHQKPLLMIISRSQTINWDVQATNFCVQTRNVETPNCKLINIHEHS